MFNLYDELPIKDTQWASGLAPEAAAGLVTLIESFRGERDEWQARAEAAELDLAAAQSAAHMPADYPHGLPSWINQHLYAAYIGARFSDSVMEQIRNGRLAFPEAPVYTELAATLARITELEAQLAEQAWRPMETVPDGEDVELLVHGYIGDDGLWYYRDGTTPLKGWRPID